MLDRHTAALFAATLGVWGVLVTDPRAAAAPPAAAPATADERVWRDFVDWLPSVPPSDNPKPIFEAYRARAVAAGVPAAEANRRIAVIHQAMRTRTDGWRVMFNNIYAAATPGFSTSPSALLVAAVEGRRAGRALDVGMGQGRNAVFLAMKGWDVTGFDVSDEGLKVAARNAARAGVKVNAELGSIQDFDMGTARWDLAVITYEPAPVTSAAYVDKLARALRPGGLVVVESFASDAGAAERRPVDIDPAQLLAAFTAAGFRILHFEDVVGMPEWTHDRTRLGRLVAQKP